MRRLSVIASIPRRAIPKIIHPATGSLILSSNVPDVVTPMSRSPASAALTLSGIRPISLSAPTTWNPSDKSTDITLSNGNLTASYSLSADSAVRAENPRSAGKYYWEITVTGTPVGSDTGVGIASISADLAMIGANADGLIVYRTGNIFVNGSSVAINIGTLADADVLRFKADFDAKTMQIARNGGAFTSSINFSFLSGPTFAPVATFNNTATFNALFGSSGFVFSVPTGYNPWDPIQPMARIPASGSLSLIGADPIITININPIFTPVSESLVLSSDPPTLNIISGLSTTPAAASLVLIGATPVRSIGIGIIPSAANIALSADAPIPVNSTPFDPSQLASLVDWYDASDSATITDDGSGKASQWNSKSSNANNMAQSTSGNRPTITAAGINGLNTLTFSGAQNLINSTCTGLPDNSAGYTVACVAQESSTGAWFYFVGQPGLGADAITLATSGSWYYVDNNASLCGFTAVAAVGTGTNTLSCALGSSTAAVYLNGTVGSNPGGSYSHNFTGNTIAGIGNLLNGMIGEIVVTSGTSTTDRQKLEGYLAWKWGTVSLLPIGHPYKSSAP